MASPSQLVIVRPQRVKTQKNHRKENEAKHCCRAVMKESAKRQDRLKSIYRLELQRLRTEIEGELSKRDSEWGKKFKQHRLKAKSRTTPAAKHNNTTINLRPSNLLSHNQILNKENEDQVNTFDGLKCNSEEKVKPTVCSELKRPEREPSSRSSSDSDLSLSHSKLFGNRTRMHEI